TEARNRKSLSGLKDGTSAIYRTRIAVANGLRKKLKELTIEFQELNHVDLLSATFISPQFCYSPQPPHSLRAPPFRPRPQLVLLRGKRAPGRSHQQRTRHPRCRLSQLLPPPCHWRQLDRAAERHGGVSHSAGTQTVVVRGGGAGEGEVAGRRE
ncbi:hypothetical protein V8G54_037799, partial [Vigna mungo]